MTISFLFHMACTQKKMVPKQSPWNAFATNSTWQSLDAHSMHTRHLAPDGIGDLGVLFLAPFFLSVEGTHIIHEP